MVIYHNDNTFCSTALDGDEQLNNFNNHKAKIMEQFTVEQIDAHLVDHAATTTESGVCAVYHKVKPILVLVLPILKIFKPDWVKYVKELMTVLDAECPVT